MEQGTPLRLCHRLAALAACMTFLACGTGVRDGDGYVYVKQTIVPSSVKQRMVLREATVDFWPNCVSQPTPITLRRYDSYPIVGAVGPAFEIQLPDPTALAIDPTIYFSTTPTVLANSNFVVGFLAPGSSQELWIPETSVSTTPCLTDTVCAPLQVQSFTHADASNAAFQTSVLALAIVQKCQGDAECPSLEGCVAGACQACIQGSTCNP